MPFDSRVKLTTLELVYPPISNQEAVWLERDDEVKSVLRKSDIYMVAGRPDSRFEDFSIEDSALRFSIRVGDGALTEINIDLSVLPAAGQTESDTLELRLGEKLIQLWDGPPEEGAELLEWFTLDKLAWDCARGMPGLERVEIPREAATFDLLYVGIAKTGDSFGRLFANGHKARTDILSNEPQRLAGARVSDEIFLFMFHAEPLFIRTFSISDVDPEDFLRQPPSNKRIVADLEKAMIHQLRPPYNRINYIHYPRGTDGLFASGLDRYGYVIAENLIFRTPSGDIRGGRVPLTGLASNKADLVLVDGTTTSVVRFDGVP